MLRATIAITSSIAGGRLIIKRGVSFFVYHNLLLYLQPIQLFHGYWRIGRKCPQPDFEGIVSRDTNAYLISKIFLNSSSVRNLAEPSVSAVIKLSPDVFVDKTFLANNRQLDEAIVCKALEPIFKGKEKQMIKSIFDEKYDAGVMEGEAQRGRSVLLAILRKKFNRIPKEVERAIQKMNDPISLESWAVQAATCQSMDEFAEMLR